MLFRSPALVTDMPMYAAIGDDFDFAVGEQYVNQDTVVFFGIPHAQQRKYVDRTLP